MMTFVDPVQITAFKSWWDVATRETVSDLICEKVSSWHRTFLVRRRKEDMLSKLKQKHVEDRVIGQFASELGVYDYYEGKLVHVLQSFSKILADQDGNPFFRERLKNLYAMMIAYMSNMRSASIHPILPGGREYTKQFSPSRRHLIKMERPKTCVGCDLATRPSIPCAKEENSTDEGVSVRRRSRFSTNIDALAEGEDNGDDEDEMVDEGKAEGLVGVPRSLCKVAQRHRAHENCIKKMVDAGESCPRCRHARDSMHSIMPEKNSRMYCKDISGGFAGSSKINAVVDWYLEVPQDDKVLILSFFKTGLDLLEGIFCHDYGIDCARFDGDVNGRTRQGELDRFKTDPECRILLATVQSGGVGLNIVEANHVAFLDRWFNPFVHQQAEDRCHRIGQTKDVEVVYFDCAATIDEAMSLLNARKLENSAVVLADGFEIGHKPQTLNYKELSGVLRNLILAIRCHRQQWVGDNPENKSLIPPVPAEEIASTLDGHDANRKLTVAKKLLADVGGGMNVSGL